MAGSYSDAPSRRMAIDDDGTVGLSQVVLDGIRQSVVDVSAANKENLNDEEAGDVLTTGGGSNDMKLIWIFPELREFDGYFARGKDAGDPFDGEYSGNTTNGWDGTWTEFRASASEGTLVVIPDYRDDITSQAVSNVRSVRFHNFGGGGGAGWSACHLYGEISAGETPDRLLWFDNDDDLEFSLPQDYGDVPRGSAEDHVVYLKNNSAGLSANSVQVTAEDLFLGSGSWYTFDDGTGFASTKSLASSIGNGASSPDITIRRITPDAETLGLHATRAYANVGSWT